MHGNVLICSEIYAALYHEKSQKSTMMTNGKQQLISIVSRQTTASVRIQFI